MVQHTTRPPNRHGAAIRSAERVRYNKEDVNRYRGNRMPPHFHNEMRACDCAPLQGSCFNAIVSRVMKKFSINSCFTSTECPLAHLPFSRSFKWHGINSSRQGAPDGKLSCPHSRCRLNRLDFVNNSSSSPASGQKYQFSRWGGWAGEESGEWKEECNLRGTSLFSYLP